MIHGCYKAETARKGWTPNQYQIRKYKNYFYILFLYYYGLTSHFFASQLSMLFSTNSSQIGQFSLFSLSHFIIFLIFFVTWSLENKN